jgi:MoaA/NifB/PqqE/SkfB family radical SAM enzyme
MMNLRNLLRTHKSSYLLYRKALSIRRIAREGISFFINYNLSTGKAYPANINLVLTTRCNQQCRMCYDRSILNSKNQELSLDELKSLVDSTLTHKPLFFITGGEPFMSKNCLPLMHHLKKRNLPFGICTNGTAMDAKEIKELAELEPANVIFSIHGNEEMHDKITGRPGNFKKSIRNMKRFCDIRKGTYVLVNFVLDGRNASCVDELVEAAALAGADAVRIQHLGFITPQESDLQKIIWKKRIGPRYGNQTPRINQLISSGNGFNVSDMSRLLFRKYRIPVFFKPYLDQTEIGRWYSPKFLLKRKCLFLWKGVYISPEGDVFPCQTIKLKLGNIKDDSLENIFNSEIARKLRSEVKKGLLPACARCCKL